MKIKISKTKYSDLESALADCDFVELVDVTDGSKVKKSARVALAWTATAFFILFEVEDDHIWGTYSKDDDPIWREEAVEVFLSYGSRIPREYFELQFSPKGVKYDAWVKNPTGNRHDKSFAVDTTWNFKDIKYKQIVEAKGDPGIGTWKTIIEIPASEIKGSDFKRGDLLRGNLFRIDGYPEQSSFQALAPNFEKIPNFHTPDKFATFELI